MGIGIQTAAIGLQADIQLKHTSVRIGPNPVNALEAYRSLSRSMSRSGSLARPSSAARSLSYRPSGIRGLASIVRRSAIA